MIEAFAAPVNDNEINFILRASTKPGILPGWLKKIFLKPLLLKILKQDKTVLEIQLKNIESFGKRSFQIAPTDFLISDIIKLVNGNFHNETKKPTVKEWSFDL